MAAKFGSIVFFCNSWFNSVRPFCTALIFCCWVSDKVVFWAIWLKPSDNCCTPDCNWLTASDPWEICEIPADSSFDLSASVCVPAANCCVPLTNWSAPEESCCPPLAAWFTPDTYLFKPEFKLFAPSVKVKLDEDKVFKLLLNSFEPFNADEVPSANLFEPSEASFIPDFISPSLAKISLV